MADLIVVGFSGTGRAAEVLDQLQALDDEWVVDLQNAAAIYRDYDGTLKLDESTVLTERQSTGIAALWGGLLGALIAIPFTGGASGAAAAAIAAGALGGGAVGAATGALTSDWWRDDFGLSGDFVGSVAAMIQPGDSAILALIRADNSEQVAERFRGYGGQVLRTTLTHEQSRKLQQILDAHKANG